MYQEKKRKGKKTGDARMCVEPTPFLTSLSLFILKNVGKFGGKKEI